MTPETPVGGGPRGTWMQKLGIIEESDSPWQSPLVIVLKPDGSLQLCSDYQKVNEMAAFDAFPMPQIEEMLNLL